MGTKLIQFFYGDEGSLFNFPMGAKPIQFFYGDKIYSYSILLRVRSLFNYFTGTKPIRFFPGTLHIYHV